MLAWIIDVLHMWRPVYILLFSVAISEIVSVIIVSIASLWFHGEIRTDFVMTGIFTAMITSVLVVAILLKLIGLLRDARQAVQKNAELLNQTQKICKTGGWEYDPITKKILWTDEIYRIYDIKPGTDPNEVNIDDLYGEKDAATLKQALSKAVELGESYALELLFASASGQNKWLHMHARTEGINKRVHRVVGVVQDVTERKRLEKDLLQAKEAAEVASKEKSNFLANISHEIRTPMNVIMAMGELLKESSLTSDQREHVELLHKAGSNLLALINQVLDLAKIEAGRLEIVGEPIQIRELLGNIEGMMRILAEKKGLELIYLLDQSLPVWMFLDGMRLNQVLLNLLGNAIKFTGQGKVVFHGKTTPSQDTLYLSIEDTGIGLDPKQLENVFHPFTQADTSTTRRYGGTGLGLAISRQLVELMGGRLWAESRLGQGSTFHVVLPLRPCVSPPTSTVQAISSGDVGSGDVGGRPLQLLLVDDSEDNQIVTTALLKNANYRVRIVNNGEEALKEVHEHDFDLILMDMQMPVMDGYTATRLIRQWEKETGRLPVPIIALTAHAFEDEEKKSLSAGCNVHLTKPVRKDKLLGVIQQVQRSGAG
ncbi:MAG: response regulator [Magnetococcales bacterium]|nr:response regulator [Magnetococcales bacterium]